MKAMYIIFGLTILSLMIGILCMCVIVKEMEERMERLWIIYKRHTHKYNNHTHMNDMSQVDPKFDSERAYLETQFGIDDYQRKVKNEISGNRERK